MSVSWTELLEDYLRVRRALGYKLEGTELLLRQFLAYRLFEVKRARPGPVLT